MVAAITAKTRTKTNYTQTNEAGPADRKSQPVTSARESTPAEREQGPRATPATAANTRAALRHDPTTQQFRARTAAQLDGGGEGDAPARKAARRAFTVATAGLGPVPSEKPTGPGWHENRDGSHTFRGTSGDDDYTVTQGRDGSITVTDAAGTEYTLAAADAKDGVTISTGGGNDRVLVDGVRRDLTIRGGSGDDSITTDNARGMLDIQGGAGNDILAGGRGDDNIDGGSGTDIIYGHDGEDALHGGRGDDFIYGGDGQDQLLGQDGDDSIYGSDGHDYVQGGAGADKLDGGDGGDAIYGDADDTSINAGHRYTHSSRPPVDDGDLDVVVTEDGSVRAQNMGGEDQQYDFDPEEVDQYLEDHPELDIQGSDDFVARTRADLGVMLTTEQGRGLLDDLTEALQDEGEILRLRENPEPGGNQRSSNNRVGVGQWAETYGDGTNRHPLPILFHELVHARQDLVSGYPEGSTEFEDGTVTRNSELQATGLPWIDEDGNRHDIDDYAYSDNLFRQELGLPERETYGGESGSPSEHVPDDGSDADHDHQH